MSDTMEDACEEQGTMEDDCEAQDLDTIICSINKEIEEDTYCLRDNVSEREEDACSIRVEYVANQYCVDDESNLHQSTEDTSRYANLDHCTDDISRNANVRQSTNTTNIRSRPVMGDFKTQPKVLNIASTSQQPTVVSVQNAAIKTEEIQFTDDTVEYIETNEEIYEYDEVDELNETGNTVEGHDAQRKTLLKMIPVKSENPYFEIHECPQCSYKAAKRYMLSRHLKTHSDDRPYVCSVCDRGFKTNHTLKNHINVHLGRKPYSCVSCESAFTTPGDLSRHVRYKHTHEKRHKCTECEYATVELSKLRRHMRAHTGERPYQCPHCTYASPDTFKLKRHLRTHTGEKPYQCDICQSRFTQSNSLKSHKLIHSVDDKPVFQCSLCPTTCSRKTDLRIHVQKLHYSDTPFPCKRCGKELPDRYSYKVHIKTHLGERCYSCTMCHYKSISLRNLEIHKQIHSNEKPFACDLCGQTFRQKQLLTRHTNLYHTENYLPPPKLQKIHDCPYCTRSFAHKGNLVRHMQVHDSDNSAANKREIPTDISIEKVNSAEYNDDEDDPDMTGENYEEFEVIAEAEETDEEMDNNCKVGETILPTNNILHNYRNNKVMQKHNSRNQRNSNITYTKVEIESNNEDQFQSGSSIVKIEKSNDRVETQFVERITEEESVESEFMVVKVLQSDDDELDEDDDDNCVILTNLEAHDDKYRADEDVENCFGFKAENDGSSNDMEQTVLLNIIEEN